MSKVDPRELAGIDKRTSLLLRAARAEVDPNAARELERELSLVNTRSRMSRRRYTGTTTSTYASVRRPHVHPPVNGSDLERLADQNYLYIPEGEGDLDLDDGPLDPEEEDRAVVAKTEDPGIDALRGTFGTVGTIIRARRRATVLAQVRARVRAASESAAAGMAGGRLRSNGVDGLPKGGDPEKAVFRREGDVPSSVFVATPESGAAPLAGAGVVDATGGGGSTPSPLEQSNREKETNDPIAQGAALDDAAQKRARTLPAILKSDHKPAFLDSQK